MQNHEIRLACEATTGPGDRLPNAHRVKSYLVHLQPVWDPLPIDFGESFDQIARYIWENYGVKTMLSDTSVMSGMTDFHAEYYTKPSDSYTVREDESGAILESNARLLSELIRKERTGKGRARHNHPTR